MKRAGKRPKGKAKSDALDEPQAEVVYPPNSMIIVGNDLTQDEATDAIASHFAEYFTQMEELNPKRKF